MVLVALSVPVGIWMSALAGFLFGFWIGTAVVSVAAMLGALLAFLAARYVFFDAIHRAARIRPRLKRWLTAIDKGLHDHGAYYVLLLRLTPVIPFWALNLGLGLTRVRLRDYWWATQLGMSPGDDGGRERRRESRGDHVVSRPPFVASDRSAVFTAARAVRAAPHGGAVVDKRDQPRINTDQHGSEPARIDPLLSDLSLISANPWLIRLELVAQPHDLLGHRAGGAGVDLPRSPFTLSQTKTGSGPESACLATASHSGLVSHA